MNENDQISLNEKSNGFITQISNENMSVNDSNVNNQTFKMEPQHIEEHKAVVVEDSTSNSDASTCKAVNNKENDITHRSVNQQEEIEKLNNESENPHISTSINLENNMNFISNSRHINRYGFSHANSTISYRESTSPSKRLFSKSKSFRTDLFEINPQNSLKTHMMTSNASEPDMNNTSIFNTPGLLPNLTNNNFPNRNNFFNRRIYVKYLTNRLEKESEFSSILNDNVHSKSSIWSKSTKSNINHQTTLNNTKKIPKRILFSELNKHNVTPLTNCTGSNSKSNKQNLYENQSIQLNDNSTTTSLINFTKLSLNNDKTKTKKSKFKTSNHNLGKDYCISENTDIDEKSLNQHETINQTSLSKKIVDLNFLGNKSRLASHYLYQSTRQLSELNLHDLWPGSCMYKFSIKANPWVNSFKARTFANEVNTNFRILNQSVSTPNSHHSNGNVKLEMKTNNNSSMDTSKHDKNNTTTSNLVSENNKLINSQTPNITKSHHSPHLNSNLPSIKQSI